MNLAIDRDWRVLASVALIVAGALLAMIVLIAQLEGDHTQVAVWVSIHAAFSIPGWITLPRWRELYGLPVAALVAPAGASIFAGLALYESLDRGPVVAQWWVSLTVLSLIVAVAAMLAIPTVATRALRGVRRAIGVELAAVFAVAMLTIWRPGADAAFERAAPGAATILGLALLLAFALLLSWERSRHTAFCSHCNQPIA
jgi:hypothetical protein